MTQNITETTATAETPIALAVGMAPIGQEKLLVENPSDEGVSSEVPVTATGSVSADSQRRTPIAGAIGMKPTDLSRSLVENPSDENTEFVDVILQRRRPVSLSARSEVSDAPSDEMGFKLPTKVIPGLSASVSDDTADTEELEASSAHLPSKASYKVQEKDPDSVDKPTPIFTQARDHRSSPSNFLFETGSDYYDAVRREYPQDFDNELKAADGRGSGPRGRAFGRALERVKSRSRSPEKNRPKKKKMGVFPLLPTKGGFNHLEKSTEPHKAEEVETESETSPRNSSGGKLLSQLKILSSTKRKGFGVFSSKRDEERLEVVCSEKAAAVSTKREMFLDDTETIAALTAISGISSESTSSAEKLGESQKIDMAAEAAPPTSKKVERSKNAIVMTRASGKPLLLSELKKESRAENEKKTDCVAIAEVRPEQERQQQRAALTAKYSKGDMSRRRSRAAAAVKALRRSEKKVVNSSEKSKANTVSLTTSDFNANPENVDNKGHQTEPSGPRSSSTSGAAPQAAALGLVRKKPSHISENIDEMYPISETTGAANVQLFDKSKAATISLTANDGNVNPGNAGNKEYHTEMSGSRSSSTSGAAQPAAALMLVQRKPSRNVEKFNEIYPIPETTGAANIQDGANLVDYESEQGIMTTSVVPSESKSHGRESDYGTMLDLAEDMTVAAQGQDVKLPSTNPLSQVISDTMEKAIATASEEIREREGTLYSLGTSDNSTVVSALTTKSAMSVSTAGHSTTTGVTASTYVTSSTVVTGTSVQSNDSMKALPGRKRRPGAAKKRMAQAREAELKAKTKPSGWVDSIRAAATAHGRRWDPHVGWVGYEEPDTPKPSFDAGYMSGKADSKKIGSLNIRINLPSSRVEGDAPLSEACDPSRKTVLEFPSDWEKDRDEMLTQSPHGSQVMDQCLPSQESKGVSSGEERNAVTKINEKEGIANLVTKSSPRKISTNAGIQTEEYETTGQESQPQSIIAIAENGNASTKAEVAKVSSDYLSSHHSSNDRAPKCVDIGVSKTATSADSYEKSLGVPCDGSEGPQEILSTYFSENQTETISMPLISGSDLDSKELIGKSSKQDQSVLPSYFASSQNSAVVHVDSTVADVESMAYPATEDKKSDEVLSEENHVSKVVSISQGSDSGISPPEIMVTTLISPEISLSEDVVVDALKSEQPSTAASLPGQDGRTNRISQSISRTRLKRTSLKRGKGAQNRSKALLPLASSQAPFESKASLISGKQGWIKSMQAAAANVSSRDPSKRWDPEHGWVGVTEQDLQKKLDLVRSKSPPGVISTASDVTVPSANLTVSLTNVASWQKSDEHEDSDNYVEGTSPDSKGIIGTDFIVGDGSVSGDKNGINDDKDANSTDMNSTADETVSTTKGLKKDDVSFESVRSGPLDLDETIEVWTESENEESSVEDMGDVIVSHKREDAPERKMEYGAEDSAPLILKSKKTSSLRHRFSTKETTVTSSSSSVQNSAHQANKRSKGSLRGIGRKPSDVMRPREDVIPFPYESLDTSLVYVDGTGSAVSSANKPPSDNRRRSPLRPSKLDFEASQSLIKSRKVNPETEVPEEIGVPRDDIYQPKSVLVTSQKKTYSQRFQYSRTTTDDNTNLSKKQQSDFARSDIYPDPSPVEISSSLDVNGNMTTAAVNVTRLKCNEEDKNLFLEEGRSTVASNDSEASDDLELTLSDSGFTPSTISEKVSTAGEESPQPTASIAPSPVQTNKSVPKISSNTLALKEYAESSMAPHVSTKEMVLDDVIEKPTKTSRYSKMQEIRKRYELHSNAPHLLENKAISQSEKDRFPETKNKNDAQDCQVNVLELSVENMSPKKKTDKNALLAQKEKDTKQGGGEPKTQEKLPNRENSDLQKTENCDSSFKAAQLSQYTSGGSLSVFSIPNRGIGILQDTKVQSAQRESPPRSPSKTQLLWSRQAKRQFDLIEKRRFDEGESTKTGREDFKAAVIFRTDSNRTGVTTEASSQLLQGELISVKTDESMAESIPSVSFKAKEWMNMIESKSKPRLSTEAVFKRKQSSIVEISSELSCDKSNGSMSYSHQSELENEKGVAVPALEHSELSNATKTRSQVSSVVEWPDSEAPTQATHNPVQIETSKSNRTNTFAANRIFPATRPKKASMSGTNLKVSDTTIDSTYNYYETGDITGETKQDNMMTSGNLRQKLQELSNEKPQPEGPVKSHHGKRGQRLSHTSNENDKNDDRSSVNHESSKSAEAEEKEPFLKRIQDFAAASCNASILPRQNTSETDVPFAHLAFLRTNPPAAHNNSSTSLSGSNLKKFVPPVICGRPDTIFEEQEDPKATAPMEEADVLNKSATDLRDTQDQSVSNQKSSPKPNLSSPRHNAKQSLEVKASSSDISGGNVGAKTAYLEKLAMKAAVAKVKRDKKSTPSISSHSRSSQSSDWKGFMERRKSRDSDVEQNNAQKSAAEKVEEMMQALSLKQKLPSGHHNGSDNSSDEVRQRVDDMIDGVLSNAGSAKYMNEKRAPVGQERSKLIGRSKEKSETAKAAEQLAAARVEAMMAAMSSTNLDEGEI